MTDPIVTAAARIRADILAIDREIEKVIQETEVVGATKGVAYHHAHCLGGVVSNLEIAAQTLRLSAHRLKLLVENP